MNRSLTRRARSETPCDPLGHYAITALLLAVAACVAGSASARAAPPSKGEKYALLVGVHNYSEEKELRPLAFAEPDVTELAQVLRDNGYKAENVVLMTQAVGAEEVRFLPLKDRIRKELRLLLDGRREGDTVLVALAGHGVHFKDDKDSYFCPADAQLEDRKTLLGLTEVYANLEKCQAGVKVLLVDACRNDPFTDATRAARVDLESVTRPQMPEPPKGVAAFFSCSEKEKAYEDPKLKHGVFFHFVIEGLKGDAAPDKDEVTLLALGDYVTRQVGDYVRSEYGQTQRPELVGRNSGAAALMKLDPSLLHYRKGSAFLDGKQYDKAIEELAEAVRLNPKSEPAYLQRGNAYYGKQDYDKAIADFTTAIHLDPKDAWGYYDRGLAYLDDGQYDKAAADFTEDLKIEPEDQWGFFQRGRAHIGAGQYDKAVADFTGDIHIDPKDAVAYYDRGLAYADMEDYAKAAADYNKVIELDPKYEPAYLGRGRIYYAKRDYGRAIDDFTEAIHLDPKDIWGYFQRGIAYLDDKQYDKAIADLTEDVRIDPKDTVAYYDRGLAYASKEQYVKAIADYNKAIQLDGTYAPAYQSRGYAYQQLGNEEKAQEDFNTAQRLKDAK